MDFPRGAFCIIDALDQNLTHIHPMYVCASVHACYGFFFCIKYAFRKLNFKEVDTFVSKNSN